MPGAAEAQPGSRHFLWQAHGRWQQPSQIVGEVWQKATRLKAPTVAAAAAAVAAVAVVVVAVAVAQTIRHGANSSSLDILARV